MAKFALEIGTKVGFLTIIDFKEVDKVYICECICGKQIERKKKSLESSNATSRRSSCGCKRGLDAGESSINKLYSSYKLNAMKKEIDFNLTKSLFRKLIFDVCFYCDTHPSREFDKKGHKGSIKYNGIDRVNNEIGYVTENVVTACWMCNYTKSNKKLIDFINHVNKIAEHLIDATSKSN